MTYHWEMHNPYAQKRKRNVPTYTEKQIGKRLIKMYPDADGGFWYNHPETGEEVHVL